MRPRRLKARFIEWSDSKNPPMFSFFKKKKPPEATPPAQPPSLPSAAAQTPAPADVHLSATAQADSAEATPPRQQWLSRLTQGLKKTGSSLATVFTGTRIDEDLYEELEAALLMADTGVAATRFLLEDLRRRVKDTRTTEPAAVKALLAAALIAGFAYQVPTAEIVKTVTGGFGSILGYIGIVIVLGTVIGVILERSGAAITMAETVIRLLGQRFPTLTMSIIGYLVSIPVFCDSGYVILNSLKNALAARMKVSVVAMSVALATGLVLDVLYDLYY